MGLAVDQLLAQTSGTTTQFPLQDALGSVIGLVDELGNRESTYRYGAFGQPRVGFGESALGFTGRPYDPGSGTYDLRSRAYDPETGRFLSEDPAPSLNAYPYALNNPVSYIDPFGAQAMVERGQLERRNSQQAARVRQVAQEGADRGEDYLKSLLTDAEVEAMKAEPWLRKVFLGTAVHRHTAAILRPEGFIYNLVGPDFTILVGGRLMYIELTTPLAVAAHLARGGLYGIAEIMSYVLP